MLFKKHDRTENEDTFQALCEHRHANCTNTTRFSIIPSERCFLLPFLG